MDIGKAARLWLIGLGKHQVNEPWNNQVYLISY